MSAIKFPPHLKPGDTIGITLPAGYMEAEKIETCVKTLESWGYHVVKGNTIGSASGNYFSGTDEERRADLQAMLDDKSIKAILFGRGGYGSSRIIDGLKFSKFLKSPKWLIGFSDITVFHCYLLNNFGMASIHGPMAAAFNDGGAETVYIDSLRQMLAGEKFTIELKSAKENNPGSVKGKLVGGNLSLLIHLMGTNAEIETKGNILFIEDIGEYLYSIDRMLLELKRAGKFKGLKGLIFGGFSDMKDTGRPFGMGIQEILKQYSHTLKIPVAFNFPASHSRQNMALKIGAKYHFKVSEDKVSLTEL